MRVYVFLVATDFDKIKFHILFTVSFKVFVPFVYLLCTVVRAIMDEPSDQGGQEPKKVDRRKKYLEKVKLERSEEFRRNRARIQKEYRERQKETNPEYKQKEAKRKKEARNVKKEEDEFTRRTVKRLDKSNERNKILRQQNKNLKKTIQRLREKRCVKRSKGKQMINL